MTPEDAWPSVVRSLFWEYGTADLNWTDDHDLIIRRVLTEGNHHALQWLRSQVGDASLRKWLLKRSGDHLSPKQLRFWELILDLPTEEVDVWVGARRHSIWHLRTAS